MAPTTWKRRATTSWPKTRAGRFWSTASRRARCALRCLPSSIHTRDKVYTANPALVEPYNAAVLALDDSVPNGTYIDMCANLPVNDPTRITVPTIIMRGQYDGIASLHDLIEFFKLLPNPDKEFAVMPSIAHGSFTQMNYMRAYHILWSFFTRPEPVYQETQPGH